MGKKCESCTHRQAVSWLLALASFGTAQPVCHHEQAADEIGHAECGLMRAPGGPCGPAGLLHEETK